MNAKVKKYLMIILSVVLGVFVISYIGYQVYMFRRTPVKTETALERTVYETIDTKAFFVRDESYIQAKGSGTIVPLVTDGIRVAKGDTVAVMFKDDNSARDFNRINEIEASLTYYKSLKNRVGVQTTDLSSLEKRIDSSCYSYIKAIQSGDVISLAKYRDSLKESITARQLATGGAISVDEKIEALENELSKLNKKTGGYTSITAENSGYYISTTDGYENTVEYDSAVEYTVDQVEEILNAKPDENKGVMGKLVDSFNWYVLCNIPTNKVTSFKADRKVKVLLPNSSIQQVETDFIKVNDNKDGKTSIVLCGNEMNETIANLRLEDVQLVINEYNGFRIDNRAIREVEGEQGVYVLVGNIVRFRKINVIYSASDYSIFNNVDNESGQLRMYDEVIVEGTDLYEGKVISR
jgi:O6-methylguanine-DNA--protein-cysteine methyltransferase